MPQVAIGVAVAAGTAAIGVAAGVTTVAAAVVSVAATAAAAGLNYALAQQPETGALTPQPAPKAAAPANGERSIVFRQPVPPRRFVYGKCRTGGCLFFEENNNPSLYIGTLISDQAIQAIDGVYFGDTTIAVDGSGNAVTGTIYTTYFSLEAGLGGTSQAVSALLAAAFPSIATADYKQHDIARAVCRLGWGADAAMHSTLWGGSIEPVYLVRGVKVYDPRDAAQSATNRATWTYSDNPALCVAHAITNVWHTSIATTDIDWTSVAAAANICDATITYGGASVKTFTLAGVFQAGSEIAGQLAGMLAAMGGALTFNDGLYSIHADAARTSVWTINDADIIEIGDIQHDVELANLYGAISAEYFSSNDAGRSNVTPTYTVDATGRKTTAAFPFSATNHSAQILAYRQLIKSREGGEFTITLSDAALWLTPFADLVTIASTALPIIDGVYEVLQIDLQQFGCAVKLRKYSSTAYAAPSGYLI
jgi:hypothetical protein